MLIRGAACHPFVYGNELRENSGAGIVATGAGWPVLEKNKSVGNLGAGIFFNDGMKGEAVDNTCEKNKLDGLVVINASPDLRQNESRFNEGNGISLQTKAGGNIVGNACQDNAVHGIAVHDAGTDPILKDNRLIENQQYGIGIDALAKPRLVGDNACVGNKAGMIGRPLNFPLKR